MTDSDGPQRPNHKGRRKPLPEVDPELAAAYMDTLAQFPGVARDLSRIARQRGTTIDAMMREMFAKSARELGLDRPLRLDDLRRDDTRLRPSRRRAHRRNSPS